MHQPVAFLLSCGQHIGFALLIMQSQCGAVDSTAQANCPPSLILAWWEDGIQAGLGQTCPALTV